ncbi:ATP-dependent DNA helicase PIF1-like [Macrosteles quadrilineatus]|uniref:ATP-dependent DNA helicase PIF1-like n=1 Tax=Macrosteles quadrilineatus TaxID=74068 RepID=UPI0023E1427D|nr:ATP-dependent DNA helicase PIF1-like [Macrosteles quadrilineatus]XP_054259201.1 ATP-dependent DNA helicase PIF1-like [Macrosteles quadrilineatus]
MPTSCPVADQTVALFKRSRGISAWCKMNRNTTTRCCEAATFMTGPRLRSFFVILCNMGAPAALLWDAFRDSICEDHIERNPLDVELAYKLGLIEIDRSLRRQGSCVADHGLPNVHDDMTELGRELLLHSENQQRAFVEEWVPKLSEDQNRVFEYVTSVLNAPASGTSSKIIFLDGPGGYRKTSSGIAASNMPGGTTAHSMFRLPLDFSDSTGFWNITNGSQRAELIRAAKLIVFDEAPMAHRFVFEVLDRSLRDLMRSSELFGGKIFLCCGDFRQIAPVVVNARTPTDIVCVSLRASHLWQHFKMFALTTAHRTSSSTSYSEFLLRVGNGTVSSTTFLEGRNEQSLIPLLGIRQVTSLTDLVDSVFPANVLLDSDLCSRRAILSTLIVNVKEINDHI